MLNDKATSHQRCANELVRDDEAKTLDDKKASHHKSANGRSKTHQRTTNQKDRHDEAKQGRHDEAKTLDEKRKSHQKDRHEEGRTLDDNRADGHPSPRDWHARAGMEKLKRYKVLCEWHYKWHCWVPI